MNSKIRNAGIDLLRILMTIAVVGCVAAYSMGAYMTHVVIVRLC